MPEHVTEWLNAYLDGELRGSRLQQVEAHLAECKTCHAELRSLTRLSVLLHEIPAPELASPERFASRVNLLLPHPQTATSGKKVLELGWWMIPVGLLAAWIFIGTSGLVSDIVSVANHLGLLTGVSNWVGFGSQANDYWSATLGRFGVISGNSLNWAEAMEVFTRTALPQFSLHVAIALLYLSWMAIWWARQTRQGRDRASKAETGSRSGKNE